MALQILLTLSSLSLILFIPANAIDSSAPSQAHSPASNVYPPPFLKLENVCKQTKFPPLCISTLTPVFKGPYTNRLQIADLMIEPITNQIKAAVEKASTMKAQAPANDKPRYDFCNHVYHEAQQLMEVASYEIGAKGAPAVKDTLSTAISMIIRCDPQPSSNRVSPLASVNKNIINMMDNVISLCNKYP